MRSDEGFKNNPPARLPETGAEVRALAGSHRSEITPEMGGSHSGNEPHNVFFNSRNGFLDVSAVSGIDDAGDGRTLSIFDYNRDGAPDLAIANANAPLLQIYENKLPAKVAAFRFVGSTSNRDAIGTRVSIALGQTTVLREVRRGEGFAGQNSATMLIALEQPAEAHVRWPSGKTDEIEVRPGLLHTVSEAEGVTTSPYAK